MERRAPDIVERDPPPTRLLFAIKVRWPQLGGNQHHEHSTPKKDISYHRRVSGPHSSMPSTLCKLLSLAHNQTQTSTANLCVERALQPERGEKEEMEKLFLFWRSDRVSRLSVPNSSAAWREAGKFNRRQNLIETILSDLSIAPSRLARTKKRQQSQHVSICASLFPRPHTREGKPKCRQQKKVLFATSLDWSFHSFLKRDAVCVGAMEHEECDFQF